jgi:Uma2 family endonuclease
MVTITDISQLDLKKSYSIADYLSWQFEEMVELIKGTIYKMSPAPRSGHQAVSTNLVGILFHYLRQNDKSCRLFSVPFDVYLQGLEDNQTTVVQPDVCVICDIPKIVDKGCVGLPNLIVEILSPNTLHKDVDIKFHLYEENGVNEYWIIDPKEKQVLTFFLDLSTNKYIET